MLYGVSDCVNSGVWLKVLHVLRAVLSGVLRAGAGPQCLDLRGPRCAGPHTRARVIRDGDEWKQPDAQNPGGVLVPPTRSKIRQAPCKMF